MIPATKRCLFAVLLLASVICRANFSASDPLFHLKVDGQEVALHDFLQGSFGHVEMTKPVEVEVRAAFDVRWVEVRPKSLGIRATIDADHQTVRFKLDRVRPFTVEFNSDIAKVLQVFPYVPEKDAPLQSTANVRYFGPGVHEAGTIELKSGETLYLAPGAWVKGNVRSIGTHDIAIRGRGVLDGILVGEQREQKKKSAAASGSVPDYAEGENNMIYFKGVKKIRLEGITIVNSSSWTVYTRSCRDFHADGANILNQSVRYGNDGFDVVSTSDVLLENLFVRTNDDCVVIKNIDDVEMKNIIVRDSTFWNMPTGGNGLEIGFELRSKPVSNIIFKNCDIIHVERGAAISIHQGDSGTLSDVLFEDIRVEDVRRKVFDFCVLYAQYGVDAPSSKAERDARMDRGGVWDGAQRLTPDEKKARASERGHVRNVIVRGLHVVDGPLPYSVVSGYDDDHRVDDVLIEDFTYLGRPLRTPEDAKLVTAWAQNIQLR